MNEEQINKAADEIVEYSGGASQWYFPDNWDDFNQSEQDRVMALVYEEIDMCAQCGWIWWTSNMGIDKWGELSCSECIEQDEEEQE